MRRKSVAVLAIVFVLIMAYFQQGFVIADEANVVDNGTKDRLIEQYGLDDLNQ